MKRRVRSLCACSVVFFLVFALFSPDDALCFDTDTLKTTGIIMGITFGVALVVVLVVGTIRDLKGRPDEEEEDDDVWSQHPVLRTLGYRPVYFPLLGEVPLPPEDPSKEGRGREREIEAFLQAKIDATGLGSPFGRSVRDSCPFTFGTLSYELALSNPATARTKSTLPFSIWQADERS